VESNSEKIIGFQRLFCKNPECHYLLKTFYFLENWQIKRNGTNDVALIKNNGSSHYLCPACKAKNYIVLEGDKFILEKIINYELQNRRCMNN
jgi:Zn finger protein HypA/HybF involved in hydrogenase expression